MSDNKIVHFVWFETGLDPERFMNKWENFVRSENSDIDVTLQESKSKNLFCYIAQHRCDVEEFQFIFTKAAKISRSKEAEIRVKQVGGYSIVQQENFGDAGKGESKVFAFINLARVDLKKYNKRQIQSRLNVYEAFYENCSYAYILEFFVKDKYVLELVEELKHYDIFDIGIYKECLLHAV